MSGVDCIVAHHSNSYASGVSRFDELLAGHLGVPFLALHDDRAGDFARPLLSFKPRELASAEVERLASLLATPGWEPSVFLHEWTGAPIELELCRRATTVWAGNAEIAAALDALGLATEDAWTPGLLTDRRRMAPAAITVFSFGMAHKIQTRRFQQLRALLEDSGESYAIRVSSAIHATSSLHESESVYREMAELFPTGLYFLGNLSDLAVYEHLCNSTFFASFFPGGLRANNTSVAAAMEEGAVVITNLDAHSPAWLEHGVNVLDVDRLDRLPDDLLELRRISAAAMQTARTRSWAVLTDRMRVHDRQDVT
ncbi:MAG: hypothetical protein WKF94_02795 [Solirubrobacteraceae bacterium]